MKFTFIMALTSIIFCSSAKGSDEEIHLFILSGQSNMANLNLDNSFIPVVEEKFGKKSVLIVKDAQDGRPIECWYKKNQLDWRSIWSVIKGKTLETRGYLYTRLITKVGIAIEGKKLKSITFIWMQGERDALSKNGYDYKVRWEGLMNNMMNDLGSEKINFVIGRLSDFDMNNEKYPHWTMIREIQVSIAVESPIGAWVDTDEFNGTDDNLHYTQDGYKQLGKAFANKSIEIIMESK